nr:putative reverse transcriptase domain-containing protein [Tanacetum cinerariifolium]
MFDYDEMFSSESDVSMPASPINDRYQSGEVYHAVPPLYTGTFMPPKPDFVFHDVPNVNKTVHIAFNVELSLTKPDKDLSHTYRPSTPIIEDWVSDSEDDYEIELPQNAPSFVQPTKQVKTPRPSVKPVEHSIPTANHKTDIPKPKSLGNIKNRKACFVCKSLTHMIKDCDYYEKKMARTPARNHAQRGNHWNYARMTLPNHQRHVVPTSVLTKSKLVPLTAARPITIVVLHLHVTRPRPAKTIVTKPHSPPRRHINHRPTPKPSNFPQKVTTVKAPKVNAFKGVEGNWVWKPKCLILDHVSRYTSALMTLKKFDYTDALRRSKVIDSRCSRHMTGNMTYLSNFEEINGGYVAFGGNPKGGKISGLDEMIELRNDGALCYLDQIWVPLKGDVRTLIMNKAHKSKYYVHPGADKMYYDLRDRYWWPGIKKDLAVYGKENRVNIFKSIDEGPFQMGTFQETLFEGNEDALHLGPEQPRVYSDLSLKETERYNADIRATNILLQGLPKDIYTLINHYTDANDIWDNVKMLMEDHVYDEAGLSYDSDILSEVHDHDHYQDAVCKHHKVHEMREDVQRNYVVDSHADYISDSNMISYDQYDLIKMKAKALKEQTSASRPMKALTVYPPNTPATLVPRGIQKALTKEIKEIEENFEELEAEVDQHVVNRKHAEIERKNLLIANDNLTADCLSKDVFYITTDSVLTVFKFSDIHEAFNVTQKRIVELESKISNLKNKIQNDDHDVMVKHFSKLEVEHLNLQLKYQHLKESFENKKSVTSSDAPTFDSVFVIGQLKDQVQSRGNMIHELLEKISRLTKKHSDVDPIHDLKALYSQNKELHAKFNALYDLNKRWRVENEKVKRHYKELYDSIKITRAKTIDKTNYLLTEVANLKA